MLEQIRFSIRQEKVQISKDGTFLQCLIITELSRRGNNITTTQSHRGIECPGGTDCLGGIEWPGGTECSGVIECPRQTECAGGTDFH